MKTDLARFDEPTRRAFMSRAAQAFLGVGLLSAGKRHVMADTLAGGGAAGGSAKRVIYLYMPPDM